MASHARIAHHKCLNSGRYCELLKLIIVQHFHSQPSSRVQPVMAPYSERELECQRSQQAKQSSNRVDEWL